MYNNKRLLNGGNWRGNNWLRTQPASRHLTPVVLYPLSHLTQARRTRRVVYERRETGDIALMLLPAVATVISPIILIRCRMAICIERGRIRVKCLLGCSRGLLGWSPCRDTEKGRDTEKVHGHCLPPLPPVCSAVLAHDRAMCPLQAQPVMRTT